MACRSSRLTAAKRKKGVVPWRKREGSEAHKLTRKGTGAHLKTPFVNQRAVKMLRPNQFHWRFVLQFQSQLMILLRHLHNQAGAHT